MRAAIYARFSSELQDPRSISDQFALARDYARRQGWIIVAEFGDAAVSGASLHNRPGLKDLMRGAESGSFDVVVTESIDRLSRDLEDIAGIYKRLAFRGVKIFTLADGEIGPMHVGLRGIVASWYIADLAQKTKRGQIGRVKAGRIPGGRCYGYNLVKDGDERGRRTISDREAEVVRRIYRDYAAGVSPMATVRALNAESIPGPRGGHWNVSSLLGSPKRRNGILNNELYAGRIVYNRQTFLKDPRNGKRLSRPNPVDRWIVKEVPELAIVDAETWQAAQDRRSRLGRSHPTYKRRPKHLFSGLITCATCGGNMIVNNSVRGVIYFACSTRTNRQGCENRRTVPAPEIEKRVLEGLKRLLLSPEAIEIAVHTYRVERARLAVEHVRTRSTIERELSDTKREIGRMVEAIKLGGGDLQSLVQSLAELEAKQRRLEAKLPSEEPDLIALHPQAAKRYRDIVESMHAALRGDDATAAKAIELLRSLLINIRVTPTPKRSPVALEITGDVLALLSPAGHRDGTGVTNKMPWAKVSVAV